MFPSTIRPGRAIRARPSSTMFRSTLKEDEIVGLLGRSGCGKSSLLRIVSGLVSPAGGEVSYLGQPVRGPVDGVAMVFQSFALFPWLTVLANVELGLRAKADRARTKPEGAR